MLDERIYIPFLIIIELQEQNKPFFPCKMASPFFKGRVWAVTATVSAVAVFMWAVVAVWTLERAHFVSYKKIPPIFSLHSAFLPIFSIHSENLSIIQLS